MSSYSLYFTSLSHQLINLIRMTNMITKNLNNVSLINCSYTFFIKAIDLIYMSCTHTTHEMWEFNGAKQDATLQSATSFSFVLLHWLSKPVFHSLSYRSYLSSLAKPNQFFYFTRLLIDEWYQHLCKIINKQSFNGEKFAIPFVVLTNLFYFHIHKKRWKIKKEWKYSPLY